MAGMGMFAVVIPLIFTLIKRQARTPAAPGNALSNTLYMIGRETTTRLTQIIHHPKITLGHTHSITPEATLERTADQLLFIPHPNTSPVWQHRLPTTETLACNELRIFEHLSPDSHAFTLRGTNTGKPLVHQTACYAADGTQCAVQDLLNPARSWTGGVIQKSDGTPRVHYALPNDPTQPVRINAPEYGVHLHGESSRSRAPSNHTALNLLNLFSPNTYVHTPPKPQGPDDALPPYLMKLLDETGTKPSLTGGFVHIPSQNKNELRVVTRDGAIALDFKHDQLHFVVRKKLGANEEPVIHHGYFEMFPRPLKNPPATPHFYRVTVTRQGSLQYPIEGVLSVGGHVVCTQNRHVLHQNGSVHRTEDGIGISFPVTNHKDPCWLFPKTGTRANDFLQFIPEGIYLKLPSSSRVTLDPLTRVVVDGNNRFVGAATHLDGIPAVVTPHAIKTGILSLRGQNKNRQLQVSLDATASPKKLRITIDPQNKTLNLIAIDTSRNMPIEMPSHTAGNAMIFNATTETWHAIEPRFIRENGHLSIIDGDGPQTLETFLEGQVYLVFRNGPDGLYFTVHQKTKDGARDLGRFIYTAEENLRWNGTVPDHLASYEGVASLFSKVSTDDTLRPSRM